MSPNCPKFLINDVIPEVVIIFRLRNIFFWIQRSFLHYNRSNKFFRRVNTFWFKSISMWRYDPLKQSFLLRSTQVTSSPKLIWGTQFWAHLKSPKISNFQKSISSSKNIFFGCVFFLLAPYDFGASFKIIKSGVIFWVKFPFKNGLHLLPTY